MTPRKDRRRQDRAAARLDKQVDGFTRRQLLEAEEELVGESEERVADPETTYGVFLNEWMITEHRREALRLQYLRVVELKQRGRRMNPDEVLTEYAQIKETMELIESQIVEFLDSLDDGLTGQLLSNRHFIPGTGVSLRTPDSLKAILEKAMYGEDAAETLESPTPTPGTEGHTA
jgi:transposase